MFFYDMKTHIANLEYEKNEEELYTLMCLVHKYIQDRTKIFRNDLVYIKEKLSRIIDLMIIMKDRDKSERIKEIDLLLQLELTVGLIEKIQYI